MPGRRGPTGYRESPHPIRTVGVGFNATDESRAALAVAHQIAREGGAALRLCTSITMPVAFAPGFAYTFDWSAFQEQQERYAKEALEEAVAGLGDVPVSTATTEAAPAQGLEALSDDVDLLVAGSRGWGVAHRVVLGSTTDRLVHHARCPVLVVPRPRGDEA